jgi:hypothetical protein
LSSEHGRTWQSILAQLTFSTSGHGLLTSKVQKQASSRLTGYGYVHKIT